MSSSIQWKWYGMLLLTVAMQILFLRDLAIGNLGFCFLYLWALVKAPIQTPTALLLISSFALGWVVDIFYNTHGMHAFACVFIAMLRPVIFKILTPANGYDERSSVSLAEMKALWFFPYLFSMMFVHHVILFLLEAMDGSLIGISLLRAFFSAFLGILIFGLLELFSQTK
jgi:hypothetical protein